MHPNPFSGSRITPILFISFRRIYKMIDTLLLIIQRNGSGKSGPVLPEGARQMNRYMKIGLFGFLIWLISFLVSVLIFPLRTSQRPLFESIMPVVIVIWTVFFAVIYLFWSSSRLLAYNSVPLSMPVQSMPLCVIYNFKSFREYVLKIRNPLISRSTTPIQKNV